jgi:AraC-like DNA-binding protein
MMKLQDTTSPSAHGKAKSLLMPSGAKTALELVDRFRLHLIDLNYAEVGPEWNSGGRLESDFLHHIELVLSGHRQIVHEGKVIDLLPGNAWYLPGCTPVERRCREHGRLFYVTFRCEWLSGVDPLLDWPERRPINLGRWNKDFFAQLKINPSGPDVTTLMLLQLRILEWLVKKIPNLGEIINAHIHTHGRFERVFELVETQLGADLRVEDLAAASGLSGSAFSMSFSSNIGMRPKDWLSRRLNQEAIKLLVQTEATTKEIAQRLKFADEYHFSRFFKRLNGVSPRPFRLNHSEKSRPTPGRKLTSPRR